MERMTLLIDLTMMMARSQFVWLFSIRPLSFRPNLGFLAPFF
jgi:hypothetical protein